MIATLAMVALVPAVALPSGDADAGMDRPTIAGRSIAIDATGVSLLSEVAVRFDRAVTGVNGDRFTLRDWNGLIVPATVRYDTATYRAVLVPDGVLRPSRLYRVALSTGIRDGAGVSLRAVGWSFSTGAQPSGGVRFSPLREVRFAPGTVTGIKIDGHGTVISSTTATLARDPWAIAIGRAKILDKSYFFIANGPWAGHFVPAGAIIGSRLVSAVLPTEAPSPTPAATSSPPQGGGGIVVSTPPPTSAPNPTPPPPTPTLAPTPTPTLAPPLVVPPISGSGIILSTAEIGRLPMSGAAWDSLKRAADSNAGSPNLADLNQDNNVMVLAKALVAARTGDPSYRAAVLANLIAVVGTEGDRTLPLGRETAAYALAADFIDLGGLDPTFDTNVFRPWLRSLLTLELEGMTLRGTHEVRANNWGTHAGASRAAIAAYLGDSAELARVATVFRGWVGERDAYAGFSYGELWWQSNPSQPVGINPPGATLNGQNVDGVLPDDQRRTGEFAWPPPCGNYPHGALDGALLTAEILQRSGYPAYEWGSRALLRAEQWLQSTGCAPSGDNQWQLPLLDARYGTSYWNGAVVPTGKNFGWTDWLYGR